MSAPSGTPWYRVAFGAHYPDLYAHRDQAEAVRCVGLLPRLAPLGPGPLLDLGCGQGRHLPLLATDGRRAVGVDLSAPLLQRAREEQPGQPLVRADMRQLPLRPGAVTAVLSLFTAFGYFGRADQHAPVVREVARVLREGGHWFLDFLDSERVAAELAGGPRERRRRTTVLEVREDRRLATGPLRVIKTVDLAPRAGMAEAAAHLGIPAGGLQYREQVSLLALDELDDLAADAGMLRVAAAGDYHGGPLRPGTSDRWLLVYRKPAAPGRPA
jgi:SAM-dependent methyltransferase